MPSLGRVCFDRHRDLGLLAKTSLLTKNVFADVLVTLKLSAVCFYNLNLATRKLQVKYKKVNRVCILYK